MPMPSPRVSVVIPAWNASPWIEETLSSVVTQSLPHSQLEIILVDDGSSDDTVARAERLLAQHDVAYNVVRNPVSLGPSAARNRGWRLGRGEWVQFLDADDLLAPSKIEVQMEAASLAPAEVAAIFSRWARLVDVDGRWEPDAACMMPSIGPDPTFDLLRADNFIATGSQLIRRSWLERVNGYVEAFRLIEDVDLLLRIVIAGGVLRALPAPAPLFWYRQRADSVSGTEADAFIDGCVRNARLAENHWRKHETLTEPRVALLNDVYYRGARHYASRDGRQFQELVRDIYRLDPQFIPDKPGALRLLTRLIGYSAAEMCAVRYRQVRRVFRSA
jgi:glycosyltransferase involved in cell wall biosynthesis